MWPSTREWVHTALLGFLAFLAQILVTKGLQLEKASRAASMQYVKVLGTVALGVVFLKEELTARFPRFPVSPFSPFSRFFLRDSEP